MRDAAQFAPAGHQQRGDRRADRGLGHRRNVVDRDFGGDLVEAPGQAQRHHDDRGERIERADVMGRGRWGHACARYAALQCAQMPEISITGVFGVKPAAREAVLMVSATAAEAASPTAPHRSQIRNTTGSLSA